MYDMNPLELIEKARKVKQNAYQPYSEYSVGAALLTDTDDLYTGVNIENITLDLCSHAERTAVNTAISEGCTEFSELAISTQAQDGEPPCLTCRQYLVEFCSDDFTIYCDSGGNEYEEYTLGEITPHAFRPKHVQEEEDSSF
mgnify:CR=1 FL=1